MFGRKKRRQEPIAAVAPEPLVQDGWQSPEDVDDGAGNVGMSVGWTSHAAGVSRETSGGDDAGGDMPVGESLGASGRGPGEATRTFDGTIPAIDADVPSGWAPTTGTLSEVGSGTGVRIPAPEGWQPPAAGIDAGASGARVEGAGAPERGVSDDGSSRVDDGFDARAAIDATSDGKDRGDANGNASASIVVAVADETEVGRGADAASAPATSLGSLFPDGADGAHGAFSSAPRLASSRPTVSTSGAGVSRETEPAATTTTVSAGGTDGDRQAQGSTSAQAERTGENEEVRSQQQEVFGAAHDDEARRAALVDSLPDADEDTPLMAQIQADARRRIQLRGRRFPRPEQTRIITVANQKGGVGKTTTTVNLAAALAQSGLNVLVLDNDPQGNASTALGVEHHAGTPSIYEVLVDEAPMAGAVQECPDVPNLWCVPATIDLSGAEIELVSMVARETRLRTALDAYLTGRVAAGQEPIDYVFVDCPPSLGLLTVNAFVVGREVLIPIQCEYYALEGLTQLLKTIQMIQAHLNPELHVSTILLTMYDSRTNLAQQVAQEVRDHFPETTLRTSVPRSVRISEAPSYGQTVITYDSGSTGALAYLEAARELAERGAAGGRADADASASATDGLAVAGNGDGMHHTNENGTPDGTPSVVGSSAGTHLEEQ